MQSIIYSHFHLKASNLMRLKSNTGFPVSSQEYRKNNFYFLD